MTKIGRARAAICAAAGSSAARPAGTSIVPPGETGAC